MDMGAYESAYFPDCNMNGTSDSCDVSPVYGYMCTVLGDLVPHMPGSATWGALITLVGGALPSNAEVQYGNGALLLGGCVLVGVAAVEFVKPLRDLAEM